MSHLPHHLAHNLGLRRRQAVGLGLAAVMGAGFARAAGSPAAALRTSQSRLPTTIPPGYVAVGREAGIPPIVMFSVACQESVMNFGPLSLPYPWTLCVQGKPARLRSYREAVATMRRLLAAGVTNIDCGAMQVNWGWHADKLGSPENALDPYPNLRAGARILRDHFNATGQWFAAVGRYHHPTNTARASRYATGVFDRINRMMAASRRQATGASSNA